MVPCRLALPTALVISTAASRPLAVALLLCGVACHKSDAATGAAPSASAQAPAAPSAVSSAKPAGLALTQDAITLIAAGVWQVVDGKTLLLWTVRNTTDRKLVSATIVIYYYDQNKRQLGRKVFDETLNIDARRSKELPIGIPHPQEPKGVEYREAVFTKAVFGDGAIFDDPSQAPEKRAYEEPKAPEPPP